MATRYKGDPYWITLRFLGKCASCGAELPKGSEAFKYKDGSLYGEACGCGEEASREFSCAADDEDLYMSGY